MALEVLRQATYQDLFDLPDNVIGEIIHGQLRTQPRPGPKHALAASAINGAFSNPYQYGRGGPGGWWILHEPELHLGEHVLVPDLAGWRRERMPSLPEEAFFSVAPDWVCEVISPATAKVDRVIKMPVYAGKGVDWLWLVDPDLRILEVYRLCDGHWLLEQSWQESESVQAPPFADVTIELGDWWVTN